MLNEREKLAYAIGNAFATTFWQVIKDEPPKKFTWEKFYESNKQEVIDKTHLYFPTLEAGDELETLKVIADKGFKAGCDELQKANS